MTSTCTRSDLVPTPWSRRLVAISKPWLDRRHIFRRRQCVVAAYRNDFFIANQVCQTSIIIAWQLILTDCTLKCEILARGQGSSRRLTFTIRVAENFSPPIQVVIRVHVSRKLGHPSIKINFPRTVRGCHRKAHLFFYAPCSSCEMNLVG